MLPAPPQFWNQEPPRAQQLLRPDFAMMPHLEHTEPMIVVVAAVVYVRTLIKDTHNGKNIILFDVQSQWNVST